MKQNIFVLHNKLTDKTILIWSVILYELILFTGLRIDQWPGIFAIPLIIYLIRSVMKDFYPVLNVFINKQVFVFLFIFQTIVLLLLIFAEYFSVSYNLHDTGIFASVVNNISSGHGFYNYILQKPEIADHFSPNLALLSPLFKLKSIILWLPIIRLVMYLSCLPILWELTRFYISNKQIRYFVLILWLINYPVLNVLSFEFQPSNLAIPFILLSYLFWLKKWYIPFILNLIFVLGFKEQMALVWISVGLWLIFLENRKIWGTILTFLGMIIGLLVVFFVIPFLTGGVQSGQLHKFGPFANITDKIRLVLAILFSVGFIPVLVPKALLFVIPAMAISLVSNMPQMFSLCFHYQDLPITVTFIGVMIGLSAWEKKDGWYFRQNELIKKSVLLIALSGIILYNHYYPSLSLRRSLPNKYTIEIITEISQFRKKLAKDKVVWAIDSLGVYFIDHFLLRTINMSEPPLESNPHYVLIADNINHWPLAENYELLKKNMEREVMKGNYYRLPNYNKLIIYRSTNKNREVSEKNYDLMVSDTFKK